MAPSPASGRGSRGGRSGGSRASGSGRTAGRRSVGWQGQRRGRSAALPAARSATGPSDSRCSYRRRRQRGGSPALAAVRWAPRGPGRRRGPRVRGLRRPGRRPCPRHDTRQSCDLGGYSALGVGGGGMRAQRRLRRPRGGEDGESGTGSRMGMPGSCPFGALRSGAGVGARSPVRARRAIRARTGPISATRGDVGPGRRPGCVDKGPSGADRVRGSRRTHVRTALGPAPGVG